MRKRTRSMGLILMWLTLAAPALAQSLEAQWARMSDPAATLDVQVRLLDERGMPLEGSRIDEIVLFEVSLKSQPVCPCTVIDALDGEPNFSYERVWLPFHFSRNMKGMAPGFYTVSIGVEDARGRAGRADVTIQVAHDD